MLELLSVVLQSCAPDLCRLPAAAESTGGWLALVMTQRSVRARLHASRHQDHACSNTPAQHTHSASTANCSLEHSQMQQLQLLLPTCCPVALMRARLNHSCAERTHLQCCDHACHCRLHCTVCAARISLPCHLPDTHCTRGRDHEAAQARWRAQRAACAQAHDGHVPADSRARLAHHKVHVWHAHQGGDDRDWHTLKETCRKHTAAHALSWVKVPCCWAARLLPANIITTCSTVWQADTARCCGLAGCRRSTLLQCASCCCSSLAPKRLRDLSYIAASRGCAPTCDGEEAPA